MQVTPPHAVTSGPGKHHSHPHPGPKAYAHTNIMTHIRSAHGKGGGRVWSAGITNGGYTALNQPYAIQLNPTQSKNWVCDQSSRTPSVHMTFATGRVRFAKRPHKIVHQKKRCLGLPGLSKNGPALSKVRKCCLGPTHRLHVCEHSCSCLCSHT